MRIAKHLTYTKNIHGGFTLIELLVVISIIAILASMLLPALKSARDQAKDLGCLNNLKQFGTANTMYTNDNEGFFPCGTQDTRLWDYMLMPYLHYSQNSTVANAKGEFSVYHCPAAKTSRYFPENGHGYRWKGYAYNYYITTNAHPELNLGARKTSGVKNPSNLLLMNDGKCGMDHFEEGMTFSYYGNRPNFSDSANYSEWTAIRHAKKRTNTLFADAHAQNTEVVSTAWGYKPLNVDW